MKRYAYMKRGLLITLLSLNTLSGCVQTKKELGWSPSSLIPSSTCGKVSCGVCTAVCCCGVLPALVGTGLFIWFTSKGLEVANDMNKNDINKVRMKRSDHNSVDARHYSGGNLNNIAHVPNQFPKSADASFILDAIKTPQWKTTDSMKKGLFNTN